MENIEKPVVVSLKSVNKHFTLRHENSIKERILFFKKSKFTTSKFVALEDLSIEIKAGHTIGLIGHNGSGKSTLLKIIGGIIEPSSGEILKRGRLAALLELGAGFHADLTGRENVFLNAAILGMSYEETNEKFEEIIDFSGIREFIDTQVKYYSSGMYVRLGFSVAVHTDPDILLVDEVLAVGDEAFQNKCLDKISEFQRDGRTIILVTHNLGQVVDLCDRAILLDHGKRVFDGEPEDAVELFRKILSGQENKGVVPSSNSDDVLDKVTFEEKLDIGNRNKTTYLIKIFTKRLKNVHNLICSLAILNSEGILSLGHQITSFSQSGTQNKKIFEFYVDSEKLNPDNYSVNVSFVDGKSSKHLQDSENVLALSVVETPDKSKKDSDLLIVNIN
jgi:ABC-2 type transport system ATP-binding protein